MYKSFHRKGIGKNGGLSLLNTKDYRETPTSFELKKNKTKQIYIVLNNRRTFHLTQNHQLPLTITRSRLSKHDK